MRRRETWPAEPRAHSYRVTSPRTLALPRPLVEALRAHRVRQAEERLAAGEHWADDRLVFATPIGNSDRHPQRRASVQESAPAPVCATYGCTPETYGGGAAACPGPAYACRHGGARPLADRVDDEHLQPRHAVAPPRRRDVDGDPALGHAGVGPITPATFHFDAYRSGCSTGSNSLFPADSRLAMNSVSRWRSLQIPM